MALPNRDDFLRSLSTVSVDSVAADQRTCAICQDDYEGTHQPCTLSCGHTFGESCLRTWFDGVDSSGLFNNHCPYSCQVYRRTDSGRPINASTYDDDDQHGHTGHTHIGRRLSNDDDIYTYPDHPPRSFSRFNGLNREHILATLHEESVEDDMRRRRDELEREFSPPADPRLRRLMGHNDDGIRRTDGHYGHAHSGHHSLGYGSSHGHFHRPSRFDSDDRDSYSGRPRGESNFGGPPHRRNYNTRTVYPRGEEPYASTSRALPSISHFGRYSSSNIHGIDPNHDSDNGHGHGRSHGQSHRHSHGRDQDHGESSFSGHGRRLGGDYSPHVFGRSSSLSSRRHDDHPHDYSARRTFGDSGNGGGRGYITVHESGSRNGRPFDSGVRRVSFSGGREDRDRAMSSLRDDEFGRSSRFGPPGWSSDEDDPFDDPFFRRGSSGFGGRRWF